MLPCCLAGELFGTGRTDGSPIPYSYLSALPPPTSGLFFPSRRGLDRVAESAFTATSPVNTIGMCVAPPQGSNAPLLPLPNSRLARIIVVCALSPDERTVSEKHGSRHPQAPAPLRFQAKLCPAVVVWGLTRRFPSALEDQGEAPAAEPALMGRWLWQAGLEQCLCHSPSQTRASAGN